MDQYQFTRVAFVVRPTSTHWSNQVIIFGTKFETICLLGSANELSATISK
jgi:hypothetical protein